MVIDTLTADLTLVRERDGLRLDLDVLQGLWTEAQYLKLSAGTNRPIEFTDGEIEVLPMPTRRHQRISQFLFVLFLTFVQKIGGEVHYSPLRLQVRPGKFREPNLLRRSSTQANKWPDDVPLQRPKPGSLRRGQLGRRGPAPAWQAPGRASGPGRDVGRLGWGQPPGAQGAQLLGGLQGGNLAS